MSHRLAMTFVLFAVPTFAAEPEKPRLVVLIVFDQMRGDYLQKWQPHFGKDGFVRLQTEGAWFTNCHYPYAMTATGPGHASMLTGCSPDRHGIIANEWYDRKSGATVNCSENTRYSRIPPLPKELPKDEVRDDVKAAEDKDKSGEETKSEASTSVQKAFGSPDRMLAPTLADAIKAATDGHAKVIGLSFKDRSAVLPCGAKADGVYWIDRNDGMIVTSTFYRDAVHQWVADLNKKRVVEEWFGKTWERCRPDLDYVKFSGPDEVFGEGKGSRQGIAFPHPIDGGLKRPGKAYYDALANSPFGNDLLLQLAKAAIVGEKLGQDSVPDLLTVSFSSNDLIGHTWGPDSQEVLDVTLQSDRQMADFLAFLDDKVGKGKYLLCLTADHGVCPLPESSARRGVDARRLQSKKVLADAEQFLRFAYVPDDPFETKARFIENVSGHWVYLNYKLIERLKQNPATVARSLSRFLATQDGIERTFTRADLDFEPDAYDAIGRRMRKEFHPERSGDVGIIIKPYWLVFDAKYPTGTSHGTPHSYDTHVPLLVFGSNVKPGVRCDEVAPAAAAAIFAQGLGIKPPARAEYSAPAGLFRE